jgi:hypothetical protein
MQRRDALRASAGLLGGTALTGCLGALGLETQSAWRDPPLPSNRPNAVYYPSVVEGMSTYGIAKTGRCEVALMYSYPHRFWVVTGHRKNKVVVKDDDSLHLMASVWDRKTDTVLPTNVSMKIVQNGETVDTRSPWPMLSPTMGFHYGDNVSLNGNGNYTARITINPPQAKQFGALRGTLTEPRTVDVSFNFKTDEVYGLTIRRLGDKAGTKGAPKLMEMKKDIPHGTAPPKRDLPGTVIGTASSGTGHAEFVATVLDTPPQGADNGQSYLAVSPRTPYNNVLLPLMSLSATVTRNGKTVFDGSLRSAVSPALRYHYGTTLDSVKPGDTLTLSTQTPPQTARHDGYETAFINIPDLQVTR